MMYILYEYSLNKHNMSESKIASANAANKTPGWQPVKKTAILLFSNGLIRYGFGLGRTGVTSGEVCFNTSITGYQEIMSDPSYAHQIVNFTFPHIGNVGANNEDIETANPDQEIHISGIITHSQIEKPSNYRSEATLSEWMKKREIIGISGVDTRYITKLIRDEGMMSCLIEHRLDGVFDVPKLINKLKSVKKMEGLDLANKASTDSIYELNSKIWEWDQGYKSNKIKKIKIALIDYGIKTNIIRMLNTFNCETKIFPPKTDINSLMKFKPDGILLSNGPGDPEATSAYSRELIRNIININIPIFGICLGHQILAIALGGKTKKMSFGHHGANHPVQDLKNGKVQITSMNHGFTVDMKTLPDNVNETHRSLFDHSNCGFEVRGKPIFSVQFHPEASPGPQDCYYIFEKFIKAAESNKNGGAFAKKN